MFFKRRSRANSYIENGPLQRSQSYDEKYDHAARPGSSRNPDAHAQQQQPPSSADEKAMYPRPQGPQDAYGHGLPNGGQGNMPVMHSTPPMASKTEPMPDLLAQAFNQAVRPYTDKIEALEGQVADLQAWVEQLEQQRAEVHAWIDKRGLRPGTQSGLPGRRGVH